MNRKKSLASRTMMYHYLSIFFLILILITSIIDSNSRSSEDYTKYYRIFGHLAMLAFLLAGTTKSFPRRGDQ